MSVMDGIISHEECRAKIAGQRGFPLSVDVRLSSLPEGFLQHLTDMVRDCAIDLASLVCDDLLRDLSAQTRVETAGSAKDTIIVRWVIPEDFDGKIRAAFGALRSDLHKRLAVTHPNSSSLGVDTSASELPTPARTDDDGMVTIRLPSAMLARLFPVEGGR